MDSHGCVGTPVKCRANFVPITALGQCNASIYQYHVSFVPEVDSKRFRYDIMHNPIIKDKIGDDFIFDGMILYLPRQYHEIIVEVRHDLIDRVVAVKIKQNIEFKKTDSQAISCYSTVFKRCLDLVGFKQLGKHYCNPSEATKVMNYDLEVWPGFETTIRTYEDGQMLLCVENRFRILRTKTFLQILEEERESCHPNQLQALIDEKYSGQTIVTYYNNKLRKISSIDWNLTPDVQFRKADGVRISLKDYYKEQYGQVIKHPKQPIIISEGRPKQPDQEPQKTYLVPELCQPTGITAEMLKDKRIMRALSVYMRLDPTVRVQRSELLIRTIKKNPKCKQLLESWKIDLSDRLIGITARELPCQRIITAKADMAASGTMEWSKRIKREGCFRANDLTRWVMVCPDNTESTSLARTFIEHTMRIGHEMNIRVMNPWCIPVYGVNVNDYMDSVRYVVDECKNRREVIQIIVVLLASDSKMTYDTLKKYLNVENAVPSQLVLLSTLSGKPKCSVENKNLSSIVLKIVQQIVCKIGGALWKVNIPLKRSIIMGYDLYYDSYLNGKTVGAAVSTIDDDYTEFYSQTATHDCFTQLGKNLSEFVKNAVRVYYKKNGVLPEKFFLYRDGVGDGQVLNVKKEEVAAVVELLKRICKDNNMPDHEIKLAFYVVTKKSNMRLFKIGTRDFENPSPGTVVDSTITRADRLDFFLVPQFVSQGTVTPVSYNLIYDRTGLNADRHQMLSYKLCHLYYNWQGTVRVPAPCQYAHKLAFFVAQSLHKVAHEELNDRLYFL